MCVFKRRTKLLFCHNFSEVAQNSPSFPRSEKSPRVQFFQVCGHLITKYSLVYLFTTFHVDSKQAIRSCTIIRQWCTVVSTLSTNRHRRGRCWQTVCLYQAQSCSAETVDSLSYTQQTSHEVLRLTVKRRWCDIKYHRQLMWLLIIIRLTALCPGLPR